MPLLELTAEMVGPERTRLTLAYIETVMLWPNDSEQRRLAFEAAHAAHTLNVLGQAIAESAPIALFPDQLLPIAAGLAAAPPLKDMQSSSMEPFVRGTVAGMIFGKALIDQETGDKSGLQAIKADIIRRYKGKPHFEKLSLSTVENLIWGVYRPVAHLWAAAITLATAAPFAFPCSLPGLPSYLAVAENFRLKGESTRLRQSKGTLLEPGRTWTVPSGLPLPTIEAEWHRLVDPKVF